LLRGLGVNVDINIDYFSEKSKENPNFAVFSQKTAISAKKKARP
jgi:uncharacterized protein (DUF736 family)